MTLITDPETEQLRQRVADFETRHPSMTLVAHEVHTSLGYIWQNQQHHTHYERDARADLD